MEKASDGSFARITRKTAEDDDDDEDEDEYPRKPGAFLGAT